MINLPDEHQRWLRIPGSTLRIPANTMRGGDTYTITASLLRSNDSVVITYVSIHIMEWVFSLLT